jgi:hypothetical protein
VITLILAACALLFVGTKAYLDIEQHKALVRDREAMLDALDVESDIADAIQLYHISVEYRWRCDDWVVAGEMGDTFKKAYRKAIAVAKAREENK